MFLSCFCRNAGSFSILEDLSLQVSMIASHAFSLLLFSPLLWLKKQTHYQSKCISLPHRIWRRKSSHLIQMSHVRGSPRSSVLGFAGLQATSHVTQLNTGLYLQSSSVILTKSLMWKSNNFSIESPHSQTVYNLKIKISAIIIITIITTNV